MADLIVIEEPDEREGMSVAEKNVELARLIVARHAGERIARIERVDIADGNGFVGWRFYIGD
jgi:hypothetical protein